MKLPGLFDLIRKVRGRKKPDFLREPCPICQRPLARFGTLKSCTEGHVFRDGPIKGDLINQGEHHGEI